MYNLKSHRHKFCYCIYFEFLSLLFTGTNETNDVQVKVPTVDS